MTGLADVIVCLWFLPVTLCIGIPLAMLASWLVGRLIFPYGHRRVSEQQKVEAMVPKMYVKAGA
jgi:hypothetical protein